MASDWLNFSLGEILDITSSKRIFRSDYCESGVPFYRSKEIIEKSKGNNISTELFISEDKFEAIKNKFGAPEPGDILLTSVGTLGVPYLVKNEDHFYFKDGNLTWFRNFSDQIMPKYLHLWFTSALAKRQIDEITIGSTQQALTISSLKSLMLKVPPLSQQKAISHILGSLNDKIELNRQMNETLEVMAQALFKSWFVDFDPVIDNALAAGNAIPDELLERAEQRKGIEKKDNLDIQNLFPDEFEFTEEMGWTPKGWSVTSLENVCSKITDGSHSSPKSVDEGYPMASVKDMHSWGFDLNTCRKISEEDYHELRRNNCNPLKNDVLIAKDGSYLKHIFVVEEDLDLVVLSSIAMLRPNNNINPHFLSLTLKRKDVLRMMENYVSGAVLQRIVLRDFRKFLIVNPPIDIQTYWFKLVEGMFEASWNNIHSNNSLAKLRDTLLPKLMSGELRIPDSAVILEEF